MNRHLRTSGLLILAISWGMMGGAMKPSGAQEAGPPPQAAPPSKADSDARQEQRQRGEEKAVGARDGRGPDARSRRSVLAERQKKLEGEIREWLVKAGVVDEPSQSAIIAHIGGEVRARRPIREASRRLFESMQANDVPEERMRGQLAEYRAVLEADKSRRQAAETALDAKIHYSQKPRLESMLLVLGIIGDGPLLIPGNQRGGPGGPGLWSDRGRGLRGPGEPGSREDKRRRDEKFPQSEQTPAERTPDEQPTQPAR